MFPNIGRKPFWITWQFWAPYLSRSCTLFPLSTSLVQFGPLVCFISFVFSILHHARIIPRFGSEDCRTLVLIQRVTLLYSFNVQLSPILRCSLTFLTPLRFRTNKLVDFYIGPTSIGMAKREFDRMAKYRLAKDGTPVHVELAVKYWCCTDFVIIWNSQRVVEPENFLHQPWSSEIWRSQNWIVQRPCHFWHTPIFQHKFQDFYAIMSWSTRKLQFRCIFQPQNWWKLQHRRFQVFYIITRSMSTSTLYRIRPGWRVRALNWLPKFRKTWHEQLQYWTKFRGCPPFSHEDLQAELLRRWTAHTKELHDNPRFSFQNTKHLLRWYVDNGFILFCLTTVFAPHCPCKCFPIVSFIKRRWSWKPSKMVHSLGSPSMWCNEA